MKNAYATLLSSDDYLPGVLGLKYSLEISNATYPFFVIVTDNLSKETLNSLKEKKINYYFFPTRSYKTTNIWSKTINKFYIFFLTQYDKILFLDADIIVLKNIDNLFLNKTPCFINLANDSFQRKSIIKKGELINYSFRGGTFLITPNREDFNKLINDESSSDDEETLYKYYSNKRVFYFPYSLKNYLFHSAEKPKYWEINSEIYNYIDLKIRNKIWTDKFL